MHTHSLRHEGKVSLDSLNQWLQGGAVCCALETRQTKNITAYSAAGRCWMVRSGSGLEWVGVAAGTKSWLANEQKGAVQAQLTAAYKTERQTQRGREQQEEPGRCRCWNRTRTGKLTPARHRWPCRCPSKRTVVGLSPAPSAGILQPESGCDKKNKTRGESSPPRITPARVPLPHRVYSHAAAH